MKEENIGAELRALNISLLRYLAKHKVRTNKEKSDYPDETRGLQIWVIDYLIKHQDEDIFQRDLEKEFVMRRSTATNFVKKMEQAGLIRRKPVAYDARLKKIILTDKAFELQAGMMAKKKEFETLLRGDLSEQEIKQFIATIQKIKHNLHEQ
ncbi:transcriptional regulator [Lactococcus chungangensis CAU 28 = DSM 22330]|jgi:DNA-binding MarR family transcriptional regulator|uniref:Transcriptional regulator n=1 Tax=Pseudolactococcus chungangensis CAU 28 = DSM 22330 TaxID=1122154 RepID=A0A1K2HAH5_9LACT|nr:MarR family winged helix-turn-helix transcriptional regulator [Lactococcus chungangensis]PCS04795.1 transcriptional regulator [Lactococcus chungangensis CAU 28 = DSM 22330]SFZ73868.1 DNA-binding transcriptional regulator, MarR family [Lactococcus chungangensis CAU 28 = DSM 22330]